VDRTAFLKRAGLLLLAPSAARAIDFGALAEAPGRSMKAEWLADEITPRYTTMTVTPGTGSCFRAMDTIRNELTGEVMRVQAIHGDTLSITRLGVAA
jgi:hypothetical protein